MRIKCQTICWTVINYLVKIELTTMRTTTDCGQQGLSQDLETGSPKLAIVKFWDILFFKGEHNTLSYSHKHVFTN